MSSIGLKNPAGVMFPPSQLENLKGQKATSLEAEKIRLRKATQEFESFFLYYMMKTMRKTIPKNPFTEGSGSSQGLGKDTFEQMFDMEIARGVSNSGPRSLSNLLYKSVEKLLEAKYVSSEGKPFLKPLEAPPQQPVKLAPEPTKIEKSGPQFHQVHRPARFKPVSPESAIPANDKIIARYGKQIEQAAKVTSLDPALIYSVIKVESDGDASAVSEAGASGLMQLVHSTASDYGVQNIFDPAENIRAGSSFLKDLLKRFGSLKLALAAYNAGPGNVRKYGGVPPFAETERYLEKVNDTLKVASGLFENNRTKAP